MIRGVDAAVLAVGAVEGDNVAGPLLWLVALIVAALQSAFASLTLSYTPT